MIRALIVEDEYFVRKGLISTMPWEEFGIKIAGEAGNGKKALEWLEQESIDLVITDLSMPAMNGFDLMREVRERYPRIQVAVLTCHEDFKYIQDALRLGAIDYIVKTELENDTMQNSLRRISSRLNEQNRWPGQPQDRGEYPASMREWTEQDERRLQSAVEEWLPLYWTVNDEQYRRLIRELKEIAPPIPKLQKVIHYLVIEWNRRLTADFLHEWLKRTEAVSSWGDWLTFISEFRTYLRQVMQTSAYPDDVVHRILEAAELVRKHTDSRMTQHYLAQRMKLSRSYFSKCFKDLIGMSFQDYIREIRISRAMTLLLQTSKPIADIAEECGFLDHRYFSRQFRERTGMLPSEFRHHQGRRK